MSGKEDKERRSYYGEVLALKLWEGEKVINLRFEATEAAWLSKCLVAALLEPSRNNIIDVKVVRKERNDGKHTVTVTAP